MSKQTSQYAVFTISNFLSLVRLFMIPGLAYFYLNARQPYDYWKVGSLAALCFITDFFDGYLARTLHQITILGKVLDPLADKCLQLVLMMCLAVKEPLFRYLIILLIIKESFQLAAAMYYLRRGLILNSALPAGKIATANLFLSFFLLMIAPHLNVGLKAMLFYVNFISLLVAMITYAIVFCSGKGYFEPILKQNISRQE